MNKSSATRTEAGKVYCPMCTYTVEAEIQHQTGQHAIVKPGQKCPRCSGSLDAGYIFALLGTARRAA